ncbi:MAG: dihydroxy-acid dehydratase, partial [Deltaproteobacteria bacterium]|nr:dihydroxy-acid dehydratase [Deltaproteobacteria bacterium]
DIPAGTLNVRVSEEELNERRKSWQAPEPKIKKGYLARYERMVSSASEGAVVK